MATLYPDLGKISWSTTQNGLFKPIYHFCDAGHSDWSILYLAFELAHGSCYAVERMGNELDQDY